MPAFNMTQITGDNMLGYNKPGILFGTYVEHKLNDFISLRMELNFTQKGSRRIIDEWNTSPGTWDLYRVDYLEVPLLFDHLIYNKFGATGGLALGFRVHEFYRDRYGTDDPNFTMAKRTESSFLFGGFYEHSERITFFVRHQSSIFNFSTTDNTPIWQFWGTIKRGYIHVMLSFGLRYYFGVG